MGDNGPRVPAMTADQKTTPADRAAALLQRGPAPLPAGSWRSRARSLMRAILLRAARPQATHQREMDTALIAALRSLEGELKALRERDGERIDHIEQLTLELIRATESVRRQAEHAGRTAVWARRAIEPIAAELHAAPYVRDGFLERVESPVGGAIGFRRDAIGFGGEAIGSPGNAMGIGGDAASQTDLEAVPQDNGYATFEDVFRGPSEKVADLQRCYLTLLDGRAPVLDVGCGRGELLALLASAGIDAEGVDGDPGMVARCRERGLRATLGDANEHLEGVAEQSLGAIFSAQVIEHLPYGELQRLLSLSLRKLRPGGLLIAETVNPHRIASLKTFWVDLTHQHPIFPEVALALCMIAGFETGYAFTPGFEDFETGRLQSPSYAVVASTARAAVV